MTTLTQSLTERLLRRADQARERGNMQQYFTLRILASEAKTISERL